MSIILFIIILSLLVIVHELGHFLVARFFSIRVDEFGIGFPPRAKSLFTWKGTPFTLNWLPFGGFVKIFGENPGAEQLELPTHGQEGNSRPTPTVPSDNFQNKNRGIQAAVLVAGVAGNFLFAWLLLSLGFISGLPAPVGLDLPVENVRTVITMVIPSSPAESAGVKPGDAIVALSRGGSSAELTPENLAKFISNSVNEPLTFTLDRGGEVSIKTIIPRAEAVNGQAAVGIAMETFGTVKLPPHKAIWHGLKITAELTLLTARSIASFISQAFVGRADLSSVTGPVGIVGMVGDVSELGLIHLLTFTALISINLCVINLLPVPALDGGRLLFVGIEAISRRRVPPLIFNALNTAGFALLLLLMAVITVQDISNIF